MPNNVGPYKRLFPEKHIAYILSAILQIDIRKKTRHEGENRITNRLGKKLGEVKKFRDGPLDVRIRPEIPSPESDDDSVIGEIDMLVSCGLGTEVYFAIEAKRLRYSFPSGKSETGNSEYVGKDGMMCFVTGKFAPFMRSGAMLGYVFDGDIERPVPVLASLSERKRIHFG
uniref:Uncharacterized protein n=1 Tax=Candidatus Kentrum sp. MB TaxID=2138164 RepID=A0A450XQ39_9GAMM|nr:MAG: hypothetical protein BECKMB1821G_GA0114241_10838 [Candidatus Kentron sp. MB]VFK34731.1 MAG: hypothetical protein BECKMB1821I_GA0114274_10825 [Candidatus Kentron sp. MB]VFK76911.1 MAG: hypothetical protein BECKMB1821H_GA0114242_10835 [Candidatus Kentron sp. MB]